MYNNRQRRNLSREKAALLKSSQEKKVAAPCRQNRGCWRSIFGIFNGSQKVDPREQQIRMMSIGLWSSVSRTERS